MIYLTAGVYVYRIVVLSSEILDSGTWCLVSSLHPVNNKNWSMQVVIRVQTSKYMQGDYLETLGILISL